MASFSAKRDNAGGVLLVREGENGYEMDYNHFAGRWEHIMYVLLSPTKTMCVAYSWVPLNNLTWQGIDKTVGVVWGACVMSHRKGSPPKSALRHTATARVKKCPAHCVMARECFGCTLNTGKAHIRKTLFKALVREDGVKGARIDKTWSI